MNWYKNSCIFWNNIKEKEKLSVSEDKNIVDL